MPEKDHILVCQTLAGERDAFGDLVERYNRLVYGLILETVRRPEVVEDLVQEVFCAAYEDLSGLREPAYFAAWLRRIAVNQAQDWLRRSRVRDQGEESRPALFPVNYPRPQDELYELREMAEDLWEALDRLPPEYRRVVVLRHLEGCSFRDIARFLGMSMTTVRWRLARAQKQLKQELLMAHYREAGERSRSKRKLRNKVMAVLPVAAFFLPESRTGWPVRWGRWLALSLGMAGVAGLVGLGEGDFLTASLQEIRGESANVFRVHRGEVELPAMSVFWEPRHPQAGERVRIEVAGTKLPGEKAMLHYIAGPQFPLDRVVEMAREGDVWTAEVEIPREARSLFFHVSGEEEPHYFDPGVSSPTWEKWLRRYAWSLTVYNERGVPVRGAGLDLAHMADRQGKPTREVLGHLDQEITRYPDHFQAYPLRWSTLLQTAEDLSAAKVQVLAEKESLKERFVDTPEVFWLTAGGQGAATYREIYERFPDYEKADDAAYREIGFYRQKEETVEQLIRLRRFLQTFPQSSYIDEVYGRLFDLLVQEDPEQARNLADSLIARKLVVLYAPEEEKKQDTVTHPWGGALPEGKAYSVRFDLYLNEGDGKGAEELTRRLIRSGLHDPLPYIHMGERLAEQEPTRKLAIQVLEVGLPWTRDEAMSGLPGFTSTYEQWPVHARDEMRKRILDSIHGWRVRGLKILGTCYLDEGRYDRAVECLREAAQLQEGLRWSGPDEEVDLKLGQAYEELEKWEEAEATYLRVLEQLYSEPQAEAALKRMYERRYGEGAVLRERLEAVYPEAPDFRLTSVRGEEVRLEALRGRPVLIYYAATGAESRVEVLELLEGWNGEFGPRGLEILYLCGDNTGWVDGEPYQSRERMRELAAERGYPFPFLIDVDGIYEKYRPRGNTLFLIDRSGRLRLRQERNGGEVEELNGLVVRKLEELHAEIQVGMR